MRVDPRASVQMVDGSTSVVPSLIGKNATQVRLFCGRYYLRLEERLAALFGWNMAM